ncbi:MAG: ribosome small subunit-dependent GTPase A [Candidatus Thiodiazotropha sp. DIVDIV]
MPKNRSLSQLGWSPFFQQQLTLEELEQLTIGRIIERHRSMVEVETESGRINLSITSATSRLTVGDWMLLNSAHQFERTLDRLTLFSRKAPGSKVETQLICANVDTLFIVSSLNEEFNLNRIERYLAIAAEAGVEPVVVLTKADLCENPERYVCQIHDLNPMLSVETVDGQNSVSASALNSWCTTGRTIALLGSSGVGKSTLINTLMGKSLQSTGAIREDDSKGRHTTTARSLHFMPSGSILLDSPGMRELQLYDCEQGIEESFSDITTIAKQCRFSDCNHKSEPGCALQAAIAEGTLDHRRLANYQKLMREQALNSASIAEKRAKDRALGRFYRTTLNASQKLKRGTH